MPSTASERARPALDPWRHQGVRLDDEPDGAGGVLRAATVFLTGRECPWRCVMCDLWRFTTVADTPAGAIPHQVADAVASLRATLPAPPVLKLYNAGSYFDPRAVPPADDDRVAALVSAFHRVVVESHPALVGERTWRFQDRLTQHAGGHSRLEVAIGLETAHPEALARIDKHITVDSFAAAARRLADHRVRLRVFLLVSPPFVPAAEQDGWLTRSIETAWDCGAAMVSLIPTRRGNGALEAIEAAGAFRPPRLSDLERSMRLALETASGSGERAIQADVWDLEPFSDCHVCFDARRDRLAAMNRCQRPQAPIACDACGGSAA